ncbi:amidophosphoribosyltransferase, partial [Tremellales sp. Uapishka_1]
MCGIIGILVADPYAVDSAGVGLELTEGLGLLQHRGQDAAGVVTCGAGGRFNQGMLSEFAWYKSLQTRLVKSNGLVRDVFTASGIAGLKGWMGIGHVRYPTSGTSSSDQAQPFYVSSPYGITFCHNGNINNSVELNHMLDTEAHRHINTTSDSEILLNVFANELQKTGKFRINEEDVFTALKSLSEAVEGAYACCAMLAGFGLVVFRDKYGIRPAGIATRKGIRGGVDHLVASESVVAQGLGFSEWSDVLPGEAIIITKNGVTRRQVAAPVERALDIFELIYFARPDSIIDGISVYRSRMAMGVYLAETVKKELARNNITVDVVIPVPETSRVAALECAQHLGIPYREGFVKNRYVGRTFIIPNQTSRRKAVRQKLSVNPMEFEGKVVLLVDDSIVRGTTSKEIIAMAREAGGTKIIMASCAPKIEYPNVYGIDMPTREELIGYGRSVPQIADELGADLVVYNSLESLSESCRLLNPSIHKRFECSVFDGKYVTPGVDAAYLAHLSKLRNESSKMKKREQLIEMEMLSDSCNGPMNGSDSLIGLGNHSPHLGAKASDSNVSLPNLTSQSRIAISPSGLYLSSTSAQVEYGSKQPRIAPLRRALTYTLGAKEGDSGLAQVDGRGGSTGRSRGVQNGQSGPLQGFDATNCAAKQPPARPMPPPVRIASIFPVPAPGTDTCGDAETFGVDRWLVAVSAQQFSPADCGKDVYIRFENVTAAAAVVQNSGDTNNNNIQVTHAVMQVLTGSSETTFASVEWCVHRKVDVAEADCVQVIRPLAYSGKLVIIQAESCNGELQVDGTIYARTEERHKVKQRVNRTMIVPRSHDEMKDCTEATPSASG